ncbi:MAG: acyltransferase family protein [Clostridiales bacterium]|nr:acyltransferase family protein [Clostridiales bacterium]
MKSNFWQFIKFCIVGVSNTLISQGIYFLIVYLGGNYIFAYTLGFVISVLNAYYWSNKYVFKEDENAEKRVWWKVLLKTYAAYFWGFLVSAILLVFWVDIIKLSRFMAPVEAVFRNWGLYKFDAKMLGELAASVLNMFVTIPMNFIINKFWAYRQKKTAEAKEIHDIQNAGNSHNKQSVGVSTPRLANMELLRIVSMLFVVVLHFLWKGDCLTPLSQSEIPAYGYLAWGLESFAIVAVNVYMLLSGYFLVESSFKVKRLLTLILQLWFYSIGVGVVAAAFGYISEEGFSIYYLAQLCLPISTNHYWFMTAYVFMYLFAPVLAQGLKRLTKRQFQTVLVLTICAFSLIKSVVPIKLASDMGGYDCIWYLCIFMIAAYIRIYGIPFFKGAVRSLLVYLASAACIFGISFLLRFVYMNTGKLENILDICYDYNHILVLMASVALFYCFYYIKIKNGALSRIICRIAPYTLGVYLWHEHLAIRYEWTGWLYNITGAPDSIVSLIVTLILAVALVFVIGVIIDMLRSVIFSMIHSALTHIEVYRRLIKWLDELNIGNKKEEIHG